MKKLLLLVVLSVIIGCSKNEDNSNIPPEFQLSINKEIKIGEPLEINITASNDVEIQKVEIYFDEYLSGTKLTEPYSFEIETSNIEIGNHNLTCIATAKNGESSKKETTVNARLKIGSPYGGGIVFFIGNTKQHGLIALDKDLKTGTESTFQWGCNGHTLGASSFDDGKQNTSTIVNSCSLGAGRICADLEANGFNDWYLPARNELDLIYSARNSIPEFSNVYWSSTESTFDSASRAYYFDASDGRWIEIALKTAKFNVRPIRQF